LLIWDNAAWHVSKAVWGWVQRSHQQVKQTGRGVRLLICCRPTKSPWLNPIEPRWVQGKRAVAEPARTLSADELAERICAYYGCAHEPHLTLPKEAA